jgi:hypothetical protein
MIDLDRRTRGAVHTVALICSLALAAPEPANAFSNFCPRQGFGHSVVWTVDAGTNEICEPHIGCPSGGVCITDPETFEFRCKGVVDVMNILSGSNSSLTTIQVLNLLDTSLQTWMRTSRARGRMKISSRTAPCILDGSSPTPCIGFSDAQFCQFPFAVAECQSEFCRLALCLRKWRPSAWVTTDNNSNFTVLSHEFGHTIGLNHTDDCGQGCRGELMCAADNMSHQLMPGDSRGARSAIQRTPDRVTHRLVGSGSRVIGTTTIATQPTIIESTSKDPVAASHLGRIDCATYTNRHAQCVAVIARQPALRTSAVDVLALNGWSEASGWTDVKVVATIEGQNNFAPDIALSPQGDHAYVVRASAGNAAVLSHVDLATGAVNSAVLGFRAVLPPRVDFMDDAVVVVGQYVENQGEAPRWTARRGSWDGTRFNVRILDFGDLDDAGAERGTRLVLADFDLACTHDPSLADRCVLVAPLFEEGNSRFLPGSVSSRTFSLTSIDTVAMPGRWMHSANLRANAVIGVTTAPGPRLIVSSSRRSDNGSRMNSFMREYDALNVARTASTSFLHRSDINDNCANSLVSGVRIGPATPHGGTSIDWCPLCGAGTVESLQFSREAGNRSGAFCF